jgi:hypothetical protein
LNRREWRFGTEFNVLAPIFEPDIELSPASADPVMDLRLLPADASPSFIAKDHRPVWPRPISPSSHFASPPFPRTSNPIQSNPIQSHEAQRIVPRSAAILRETEIWASPPAG